MADWNPSAPDTIGSQFLPGESGQKLLSSGFQSLAWRFEAEVTETVTEIMIPASQIDADGAWMVEVYEDGDEVSGAVQTTTYRPISDELTGEVGDWLKDDGFDTDLWQSVDGTTYDPDTYVTFSSEIVALPELTFNYGTNTWPTGQRVTAIRLVMVSNFMTDASTAFAGLAELTGANYPFGGSSSVGTEVSTSYWEIGEINPDTLLPWTAADIVGFSTTLSLGINGSGAGIIKDQLFRIYQMWVEVDWVPEERIVVGVEEILAADPVGWQRWSTLLDPNVNSVTDWDKVDGTDYVVELRNLGNAGELWNGSLRVPWLSDGETLPTGWEQAYLPVEATGLITVPFADYTTPRSSALVLSVSGLGDSADGQPWSALNGYTGEATEQQITTSVGGTYERLRFGWLDTTALTGVDPPTEDLTVKVKRQSDDTQFGSTETFTVAQLQAGTLIGTAQADPEGANVTANLYLIERDLTTPATLATTQYFVEFTGDGHAVAVTEPVGSDIYAVLAYTTANMDQPNYICEGPDGNLWFTASGSDRIGRVTTAGVITMFTGFSFPVGICVGPDGNLWVANVTGNSVMKVNTSGTILNTYTSGGNLAGCWGICSDTTNLWVTNATNDKVCKVTTAGVVTAYSDAGCDNPHGICWDGTNLWTANVNSDNVSKITTGGAFTNYGHVSLDGCWDICVGPDGKKWVTNQSNGTISKFGASGWEATYSPPLSDGPYGICSDGTDLWYAASGSDRIGRITTDGVSTTYADAALDAPYGICLGPDDNLWFAINATDSVGTLDFAAAVGANATYHGQTDAATIGALEVDSDYPVTLSTIPDAPADFVAVATETDLLTATDTSCGVDTIDFGYLTWDDTELGESFGHYEIQRDNGDALGFQTIAVITDETVEAMHDYESVRGSVGYRMRVCRSTDGVCSDWTDTETIDRDAAGPALWLFTSNAYPELTVAYNVTDSQSYGWPDAPRQRVINHFGTENKSRYVEVERRLTEFPLDLTVYAQGLTSDITANQGVAPFYPLLELCSQTSAPGVPKTVLPYVAVIDPHGNSWYSAVTVDVGNVLVSQSNAHTCTANIVQLTEEPCPVDVEPEGS